VSSPSANDWDEPIIWSQLAADPMAVVVGQYEEQSEDLPPDVYEAGLSYPLVRFELFDSQLHWIAGTRPRQCPFTHCAVRKRLVAPDVRDPEPVRRRGPEAATDEVPRRPPPARLGVFADGGASCRSDGRVGGRLERLGRGIRLSCTSTRGELT
jgi:hypothetical protein